MNSFDDYDRVRICEVMDQFLKNIPISKNFLNFSFDIVEKQNIINLSNYSHKSYIFVVLSDSQVAFLEEGEHATFCPFLYRILFIDSIS